MKLKYVFLFVLLLLVNNITATTYYVNSETGDDQNSGKSEQKAWKSLWKVNKKVFKPGDIILFAAGLPIPVSWNLRVQAKKAHR